MCNKEFYSKGRYLPGVSIESVFVFIVMDELTKRVQYEAP